ncbi:MAG TPA: pitrilysin family protein [Rhizomicrobium sp.]|jgi:predicted Zn-dependent peptidase
MTIEISKLSNGLTVITDPMANLESAALGVWIATGSRNEHPPEMGLSHMLEHMAFKGTATRSARQIAEEIEAVGGYLNAYTSREQTAFHARILKNDVGLALDLVADILVNPTFAAEELERERQVVLQELGQARDTPDDIIFDHLQSVIYRDQPLGWAVLGEEATVTAFTPAALRDYSGRRYRADAMTLVSSGAVSHRAILAMAEEKFAPLASGGFEPTAPGHYVGGDIRIEEDLEQAHIVYAFPGVASNDPDFHVAQIHATILGGGMSSRLFQEVREKRGLCYSIYAFANNFQDTGFTGIYAGTGEKEAGELSAVIAGEMEAMTSGIGDAELARAKAQLKSGLLMGLERPGTRAEQIAGQIFTLGHLQSAAEIVAQIDAVDASMLARYAAKIMAAPTIAAMGPVKKLERFDVFAARFASGRQAAE